MSLLFAPENDECTIDTARFARTIAQNFSSVLIGDSATRVMLESEFSHHPPVHTECFFIGHGNRHSDKNNRISAWIVDHLDQVALDRNGLQTLPIPLALLAYCCYSAFVIDENDSTSLQFWGYTTWIQPPIFEAGTIHPAVNHALVTLVNSFHQCKTVKDIESLLNILAEFDNDYHMQYDPGEVPMDVSVFLSKIWQFLAIKIPGRNEPVMHVNGVRKSLDWAKW